MRTGTELEVGQLIGMIHRTATAAQARLLAVPGVTVSTAPILSFIAAHPGCTAQEVADGLAVNKGLVSRALAQLVASNYVDRGKVDTRIELRLTKAGKQAQKAAATQLAAWWADQLANDDLKHRKQFVRNLATLAAALAPENQIGQ